MPGGVILCCERRLFVRECDCFCFGTAIGGAVYWPGDRRPETGDRLLELQLAELRPARVRRELVVVLRVLVEVLPALGADAAAVVAADDPRRKLQSQRIARP